MRPLVSVVVPAFRCAQYLTQAIESVLAQEGPSVELIVVNDGSPDETDEVVRPYLDRIVYIKQENRGLSAARNVGFRASHGEFICFLDADDILLPGKFRAQLGVFEREPDLGVVISGYIDVEEDGKTEILRVRKPWDRDGLERLLRHEVFPPHTALIRRSALHGSSLFPEDIDTWESQEDWQLWLDLALSGVSFGSYPEPTCLFRSRVGSIRTNPRKHYRGALRVIEWLRAEPRAAALSAKVDQLETHVEMEIVAVALRAEDVPGAAEALVGYARRKPDYWSLPSTYLTLFSRSLPLHECASRSKGTDPAWFEERVVKGLFGEVAARATRRECSRWRSASLLALCELAGVSGDRPLAMSAVRSALGTSWTRLLNPAAVLAAARAVRGGARDRGARWDQRAAKRDGR